MNGLCDLRVCTSAFDYAVSVPAHLITHVCLSIHTNNNVLDKRLEVFRQYLYLFTILHTFVETTLCKAYPTLT